ncbi:MAG TPA: hypothetical protein VFT64_11935 [Rickettsiales bacterium]|nr:hypothetical protein [Rickettsiales bacterium]
MTMPDIEQALAGLKPKKKSAQIRLWVPLIEEKLAAGVLLDDIVAVLVNAGIAINKATLKNYLYRFRKRTKGNPAPARTASPQFVAQKRVAITLRPSFTLKPSQISPHLPSETRARAEKLRAKQAEYEKETGSRDMIPELIQFYEELGRNGIRKPVTGEAK